MIEAKLDASELEHLVDLIDQSPEIIKAAKQKAFETAAGKMKQALDSKIGGTGKVRSWQNQYVGSKGGYAAVRPKAKTYTDETRKYAVGYVTNAINTGHRFPTPRGKTQRYKPRIKSGRQSVPGQQFYEATQAEVANIAQEAGTQVVEALRQHLEE